MVILRYGLLTGTALRTDEQKRGVRFDYVIVTQHGVASFLVRPCYTRWSLTPHKVYLM